MSPYVRSAGERQEHRTARPELEACLKALRKGDSLVVWRLDRLGRSLRDLIQLTQDLQGRGIGLESLTEKIDTVSTTGKLVFHVFAALAEFERNLIRGRHGGRPKKLSPKELKTIRALLRSNEVPVRDIAAQFKVNRSTLYRNMAVSIALNRSSDARRSKNDH